MRWGLAGVCFAALVAVTVATAALRARNTAARARIQRLEWRISGCAVEAARRDFAVQAATDAARLARMWRAVQDPAHLQ